MPSFDVVCRVDLQEVDNALQQTLREIAQRFDFRNQPTEVRREETAVHLLTLGCPKNRVDSEVMLGVLARRGHELVLDPEAADVLVVNTCSFIQPAKEESIDAILDLARVKAARAGRRLVVTGCLAQRYADELRTALPEVDVFVGTGDLLHIADAVEAPAADGPVVYRGAQHVLPRREL